MSTPPAPPDDGAGAHFRRQPRPGGRVAVRWRAATLPGEATLAEDAGFTTNLGVGGAFLSTDRPLPPATSLEVTVALPSSPVPLAVRAEVRWVTPTGMGVEFVALSEEGRAAFGDYFATLIDAVDHDEID